MRNIGEKITEITEQEAIPMGKPLSKAQQARILNKTLAKIGMAEEAPLDGETTDAMEQGEQSSRRRILFRRIAQGTAAAAAIVALCIVLPKLGENKPPKQPAVPPVGTTASTTETILTATQTVLASQTSDAAAVTSETANQTTVTTTTEAIKPPASSGKMICSGQNVTDGTKIYYTTESYKMYYDIWCYDTATKQNTRVYTSERLETYYAREIFNLTCADGLLYFREAEKYDDESLCPENIALYSLNPATGEKKKLTDVKSDKWFLMDNQVYFLESTKSEDTVDFCRRSLDTNKLTVLMSDVSDRAVAYHDGYFYFGVSANFDNKIYTPLTRVSVDGQAERFDRPALEKLDFDSMTISGDRIWWSSRDHKIYSSNLTFEDVKTYDEPQVPSPNWENSNIRSMMGDADGNLYFTLYVYVQTNGNDDNGYYDAFIRDERECTTDKRGAFRTVPTSTPGKYACEGIYQMTPDGKTTKIGSTAHSVLYCILGDTIYCHGYYFAESNDAILPYTYSIQKDGSNEQYLFDNEEN